MSQLVIPDALHAQYAAAATAQGVPVDTLIQQQLQRFAHVMPGTPQLLLSSAMLTELALLLGKAPEEFQSPTDVLTAVKARGTVSFAGVDLKLTTAQLREIEARAAKLNKSPQQVIDEAYQVVARSLFDAVGLGASGQAAPATAPAATSVPGKKLSHHERMAAHTAQRRKRLAAETATRAAEARAQDDEG